MTALICRILSALERRLLHGLAFGAEDVWFGPED